MKVGKESKEIFYRCQGACKICLNEGDCVIERKIKKWGIDKVRKLVYNEK